MVGHATCQSAREIPLKKITIGRNMLKEMEQQVIQIKKNMKIA
jgi:hypothetical protein